MLDIISLDKIKYLCNITSETLKCQTCFIASSENANHYSLNNYLYPSNNSNYNNLLNNFVCNYFTLNIPAIITTSLKL